MSFSENTQQAKKTSYFIATSRTVSGKTEIHNHPTIEDLLEWTKKHNLQLTNLRQVNADDSFVIHIENEIAELKCLLTLWEYAAHGEENFNDSQIDKLFAHHEALKAIMEKLQKLNEQIQEQIDLQFYK